MLVEGDVDALATATHGNTGIALSTLDGGGTEVSEVGIVATLLTVGTEILVSDALGIEPLLNSLLDRISSMVTA
jgi:hypothetical protein